MRKPDKKIIEDKSFPEAYWLNRLQRSGTYKRDLLYWNLKAINEETPGLRVGVHFILGFFGKEIPGIEIKRLAEDLNQLSYHLGYVDFLKCGMQFIQNFETDNVLKISFVILRKLKNDGTFDNVLRRFIVRVISESKDKNFRVDIKVNKNALLSYSIDNNLSLEVIDTALKDFPKVVIDHSMIGESVHYNLGRTGRWNAESGSQTWRFMENFWETS